jgi:hypothetical protein
VDDDSARRKGMPVFSGALAYFPDAFLALAECSLISNAKHCPGEPLHWARDKSTDDLEALTRHLTDRAKGVVFDTDRIRHLTKVFWRAGAALQKEIEGDHGVTLAPLALESTAGKALTAKIVDVGPMSVDGVTLEPVKADPNVNPTLTEADIGMTFIYHENGTCCEVIFSRTDFYGDYVFLLVGPNAAVMYFRPEDPTYYNSFFTRKVRP